MIEGVEKSGTIKCSGEEFIDRIIDTVETLGGTYLVNAVSLNSRLGNLDRDDDDFIFEDLSEAIKQMQDKKCLSAQEPLDEMIRIRKTMAEVIFCAKVVIDKGIETLGSFDANLDDLRQKFVNVSELVRNLKIDIHSQDKVLMALSSAGPFLALMTNKSVANANRWYQGDIQVFKFKLNSICDDDFAPIYKTAIDEANNIYYEYNKAQYQQTQNKKDLQK